jgi:hypothetical protein
VQAIDRARPNIAVALSRRQGEPDGPTGAVSLLDAVETADRAGADTGSN